MPIELTEAQRKIVCDCLNTRILALEDQAEGIGGGDYVHSIQLEIEEVDFIKRYFLPVGGSYATYFDTGEKAMTTNSCRFATQEEAFAHGNELFGRWMLARGFEVRKEFDEPNACADIKTGMVTMLAAVKSR